MPTLSGNVKDSIGNNVSRVIRVYRLSDGLYMGDAFSDPSTGNWSITVPDTTEYFAIRHDAQRGSNYGSRKLGIHCIGTNGSTDFIDVTGKTVTAAGGAQISTAQYPSVSGFLSSGYVGGSDAYLSIPDSADFDFGTGDFTVKGRFRFSSHTAVQTLIGNYQNSTTGFSLQRRSDTDTIRFGNGDAALIDVSWTPTDNVWYEIEASRYSSSLRIRVNGTTVGSPVTSTQNISGSSNPMLVGALYFSGYIQEFTGYFSEIEIHNACINTSDYSVSGTQFKHSVGELIAENSMIYDLLVPV